MRKPVFSRIISICLVAVLMISVCGCASFSAPKPDPALPGGPVDILQSYADDPNISKQKKAVIRVGIFRGEDYWYWNDELKSMAAELYQNSVIAKYQARNYPTMEETWAAMCESTGLSVRGRLEFVPEYLFTYEWMSESELEEMLAISDVDLMLTFGTVAGKYLTANADKISYDYMVYGATNTVASGIVKSETERYNDHSFALVDTDENARILRTVYDLYHFRDIGVVYENNPEAKLYSGVDDLEKMAEEYGFNIHAEYVDEAVNEADEERHYKELAEAYERLLPDIDLLFVTTGTIMDFSRIDPLLSDMIDAGVITVAQESEEQCEEGCLMYVMVTDPKEDGRFMADTMSEYCRGVPITELNQVFIAEPKLYLNYETIKRTGVKIPMKAYLAADTVYTAEGAR